MGRLAVAVLVVVALGTAIAVAATGSRTPAPGTRGGCPLAYRTAVVSSRPGSDAELVPPGARRLLVCSYSGFTEPGPMANQGPAHRLIGSGSLTNPARVSQLAVALNAIPPRSGAIACPADFGNQLVAFFRYGSPPDDPVAVGLSGCQTISNGHIQRLGLSAPVVTQLSELARPGIIRGRVQVCGGPAPGGCHTETLGSCGPAPRSCSRADRVAVLTVPGRQRLVTVRLRGARFVVEVPAGRYKLELLADGKHVHGKVVQTAQATVRAGHTTAVVFGISVP